MWTTHKCARLGPDKGTAGIKMEEPIYLHESEVKTKCKKKSLLQLIRIIPRRRETSSCFHNKTRAEGVRGCWRSCINKENTIPFPLSSTATTTGKKVEKEQKINLAIAAANSGNKPRILTLVVEKLQTKKR